MQNVITTQELLDTPQKSVGVLSKRSSIDPLYAFDPEIEKTLRRLRKARNLVVNNSISSDSVINSNQWCTDNSVASSNIFAEPRQMENNDKTLKELATPGVLAQTHELKFGLIHLLPKFHGLAGEDPHKHLKEFHVVSFTMRPQGISEDYIKMKAFPFSLDGAAKDWLHEAYVPREVLCGIQNCDHQKRNLWDKAAYKRNSTRILREIQKSLCHLSIPSDQRAYFYEGLPMMDRSMIDVASRGALMDKTPATVRHLISNMASNTHQFGIRGPSQSCILTELTSLVRQLAVEQHQPTLVAKVCGICTSVEHPTDMCPTLQETELDQIENVGAIDGFQYGKQPYQNRPFDSQQHGRQPFRPGPNQGPYATQQFGISAADSTISGTTFPTTTAIVESGYARGPDEAASNQQPGSTRSSNLPSQTILNPRGIASAQLPRPAKADSRPNANPQSRPERVVPVPFPSRTVSVPKYAKFLKELCVYKRRKIKGSKETGGMVSTLTRNEELTAGAPALPKKCRDPGIFSVPCTIGECTFADGMLDLGASIIVMPASIYRSLNFGDLEPTRMTIQLENRSIIQPLGVLI
ncbi:hypothetical protein CR513_41394, partial [Mucuna pruriens]